MLLRCAGARPARFPTPDFIVTAPATNFVECTEFIVELARRLHAYGTTAQRLEGSIAAVAKRLQIECEVWSQPTGMIFTFSDPGRGRLSDTTRLIRLAPGDFDLGKLAQADAIAEDVLNGRLDVAAGRHALTQLDQPAGVGAQALMTFSFGLASAAVAGLLNAGWADIITAGLIGWLIGVLFVLGAARPHLSESIEAIAALTAMLLAAAVATWIAPLKVSTVVIAALIVLLPGLTLTNAINELTSQHLVAGTARFAGAVATLLKLTFGTVAAAQLVRLLGWLPHEATRVPLPDWTEWVALLVAAYSFAVLFRAQRRDYPLVMGSVMVGYAITRLVGNVTDADASGFPSGVFLAAVAVIALSNAYGRWANRPGAVVRVPGIILLVPGSVGFRSMSFMLERDVTLGLDTAFVLVNALIALVVGVLFGNLLVAPRRNL